MKNYEDVCKELGVTFDENRSKVSLIVICFCNIISSALKDEFFKSKEENLESYLSTLFLLMSKPEIDEVLNEINNLKGNKNVLNRMKNAAEKAKDMQ